MVAKDSEQELPVIEKRKVERFDLSLKAFVRVSGEEGAVHEPMTVTARDVSMSGVFFLTSEPLPIGTKVDVDMLMRVGDLSLRAAKKAWIKASGVVQRIDPAGMAIRFDKDSKMMPFSAEAPRPRS